MPQRHSTFRGVNTPEHPRHPPLQLKLNAIHRCFELGEDVQSASDEMGCSTVSIYQWRRKCMQEGRAALMKPPNERKRGPLKEGSSAATEEISQLKAQLQDMQLKIDVKKGCSPNNSACEGFFSHMKNEMFYGFSLIGVSMERFIRTIED